MYFLHEATAKKQYKLTYEVDGRNIFRLCLKSGAKTKVLIPAMNVEPGRRVMSYTTPAAGSVYIEDTLAATPADESRWTKIDNILLEEV